MHLVSQPSAPVAGGAIVAVGRRVDILCSRGHRLTGTMRDRFTYPDHTEGAHVELDTGADVFVPLGELVPEGVTV